MGLVEHIDMNFDPYQAGPGTIFDFRSYLASLIQVPSMESFLSRNGWMRPCATLRGRPQVGRIGPSRTTLSLDQCRSRSPLPHNNPPLFLVYLGWLAGPPSLRVGT